MNSISGWLLHAAAGDELVPAAGAVTSLLASAAAGSGPAVDGLSCGQVVRATIHAAAAAKHAEARRAVAVDTLPVFVSAAYCATPALCLTCRTLCSEFFSS
jgi:hypothetical protein